MKKKRPQRSDFGPEPMKREPEKPSLEPLLVGAVAAVFSGTVFISGESIILLGTGSGFSIAWFLLAALISLLLFFRHRMEPLRIKPSDIICILLLLAFLVTFSYHCIPGTGCIRYVLNLGTAWIACTSSWLLFRSLFKSPVRFKAILLVLISVSVSMSIYSLYDYYIVMPQNVRQYEADPDKILGEVLGRVPVESDPERMLFESRLKTYSATGTYALSNTFAGLLGPVIIVTLGIIFWQPLPKNIRWILRAFLIILGITLILTKSRSGCLCVAGGAVLLFTARFAFSSYLREKIKRSHLILAGGICVLAIILFGFIASSKGGLEAAKRSLGFRFEYWYASLGIISDNPVLGCGPGNFKDVYTKYKLPISSEEISDPHNFVIELWATAGTPCMLLFLAIPISLLVPLIRGSQDEPEPKIVRSSQDIDSKPVPKDALNILIGGGLGIVFGFFLSVLEMENLNLMPLLFCLPGVAICSLLMYPWLNEETEISPWIPFIGMISLLINLLAAGGVMYPNIIIVFWLLAAGSANCSGSKEFMLRKPILPACLLAFCVCGAAFTYSYVYRPVIESKPLFYESERIDIPLDRKITALQRAIKLDPYSAEYRLILFQYQLEYWRSHPKASAELRNTAFETQEEAVRLSPNSARIRKTIADTLFRAMSKKQDLPELMELSLLRYSEAIERYPNHSKIRTPYATALWVDGNIEEALRQKSIALELDEQMPHLDQKMPESVKKDLERIVSE